MSNSIPFEHPIFGHCVFDDRGLVVVGLAFIALNLRLCWTTRSAALAWWHHLGWIGIGGTALALATVTTGLLVPSTIALATRLLWALLPFLVLLVVPMEVMALAVPNRKRPAARKQPASRRPARTRPLEWPACLSSAQDRKKAVALCLSLVPEDQVQQALTDLGRRIEYRANTDDPIRRPLDYLHALLKNQSKQHS